MVFPCCLLFLWVFLGLAVVRTIFQLFFWFAVAVWCVFRGGLKEKRAKIWGV